jgi:hypothetical protein
VKISAQMTVVMSAIFAVVCFGVAITGFLSLGDIADATQMADAKGFAWFWTFLGSVATLFGLLCAVDGAHAEGRLLSTAQDAGERMLYEPSRHEALRPIRWDENVVRRTIERIVADTEAHFSEERYWPHPSARCAGRSPAGPCRDEPVRRRLRRHLGAPLSRRRRRMRAVAALWRVTRAAIRRQPTRARRARCEYRARFSLGDTPIAMMAFGEAPTCATRADRPCGSHRRQHRSSCARADAGLPGHAARRAVPARAHWKRALVGALSTHGEQALDAARVVGGASLRLLDAALVRPDVPLTSTPCTASSRPRCR